MLVVLLLSISYVNAEEVNIDSNSTSDYLETQNSLNQEIIDLPNEEHIYVNTTGNSEANGSFNNPFFNLNDAINAAPDNSTIIMMNGTYTGYLNTIITVNKNLIIKSLDGGVTINAEGKNLYFDISSQNKLILENLNFINGYCDLYSTKFSLITNNGLLILNKTSFRNMNSVFGVILNKGNLKIYNSNFSQITSHQFGQIISNLENCSIINSNLYSTNEDYNIGLTVYNCHNIFINNSYVDLIESDKNFDYELNLNKNINITILNSKISSLSTREGEVFIENSNFTHRSTFISSNITINKCNFFKISDFGSGIGIFNCNYTAISSIFLSSISSGDSFVNITYSVILEKLYGNGINNYIYAPFNWWGLNSGPKIQYSKYSADTWIIMTFICEESTININTSSNFITSLNKYTDGDEMYLLDNPSLLPNRLVRFEAQNGQFSPNNGILVNGTFSNKLVNNNESCLIYAIIDFQRLRLVIGTGLTNYEWYVSNNGHDGFGDGSYNNPYKTLSHTISKALNGNTIYLFNGTYTNNWNANLNIIKNLTIVGLENAIISRENGRNIFIISEWGSLTVVNINFTVNQLSYSNPLFFVNGGYLKIMGCNVYNTRCTGLIFTDNGIQSNGYISVINSKFTNNCGSIIRGCANIFVNNSIFESTTNYYTYDGVEDYNCIMPIKGSVLIYNSIFRKNNVGLIKLDPITYSKSNSINSQFDIGNDYTRVAIIENCSIYENKFDGVGGYYSSSRVGLSLAYSSNTTLSIINNCYFVKNRGAIALSNQINNSRFIENTIAKVTASLINNSDFFKNTNFDGTYNGRGIASANTILNSTFIYNKACYGGAVGDTKEIHYCIFVNNTAEYKGNDIFSYSGDVDYSSNWWGDNQKPGDDKICIFLGNLTLNNWIIMSLKSVNYDTIKVSLDKLVDGENIYDLDYFIPIRPAYFTSDFGIINPNSTLIVNNNAFVKLIRNQTSNDFNVYCQVDNQILDLSIKNNSTELIMENQIYYGNYNFFNVKLININGYAIFNQTLTVEVTNSNNEKRFFNLITDEYGVAKFKIDYPIGLYEVSIYYGGNGYFESCNKTAHINILKALTYLTSYNYTFYGKNNDFYAILTDVGGQNLMNKTIKFTISNSNGLKTIYVLTNPKGKAEVLLNLDVGSYEIKCVFEGDDWYGDSYSISYINILPVNSTIIVPSVKFYGAGNEYVIILKDAYGTLMKGETIYVDINQKNVSDTFVLKTDDNGQAKIVINYLPGIYDVKARFVGDEIYGCAEGNGTITIEKVFTIISGFYHITIPLNGIYSVVLSDMFGKRISNEHINLKLYKKEFIKTYSGITDGNGEITFIIDQSEGTYLASLEYDGSIWYSDSISAATIVVNNQTVLSNVNLNANDLVQFYGENKYFVISFSDPNAYSPYGKTIVTTISSGSWHQTYNLVTDAFGQARLQINLNSGFYNITYKYTNNYYGIFSINSNNISVYRMPTRFLASDLIMNMGESKYYEFALRDVNNKAIKNIPVSIEINGIKYNVTTNDEGIGRILLNLAVGIYEIHYYINNPNYLFSWGSSKIIVVDSNKISTKIESNDIIFQENESINYKIVLKDILGNGIKATNIIVNITTSNNELISSFNGVTNNLGEYIFNLNLNYGEYIIYSYYKGSDIYLGTYNVNSIIVNSSDNLIKTFLINCNNNVELGKYYVVLVDENGNLVKNRKIQFIVDNKTYSSITGENGKAYIDKIFNCGNYQIKAIFLGDDEYKKSSTFENLVIQGNLTYLFAIDLIKYYRNGTQFHTQLVDSTGQPLINKSIVITIDGKNYNVNTNNDGWTTLEINLSPGSYKASCAYYSNIPEENAFATANITVISTILGNDLVKFYKNSSQFHVKVIDGLGSPIINTNVTMNINGVFYTRVSNHEGIASLNINLNPGKYTITVANPYDSLLKSFNIEVLSTIYGDNIVKYYRDMTKYHVKVVDSKGNPLINTSVKMNINGVVYTRISNHEGIASLNINLDPGIYYLTAINIDGNMISNTVQVLSYIVNNKNLVKYYKNDSQYVITIIGKDGKVVGAGETVKFNINGVFYYRQTNYSGHVKLNINLDPGNYIITSEYNNLKISNRIIVLPILLSEDLTMRHNDGSIFKSKLLDDKGNPFSNQIILFNINGMFYKKLTDDNGIAKLNINLMPGKYIITSYYNDSSTSNKIIISS